MPDRLARQWSLWATGSQTLLAGTVAAFSMTSFYTADAGRNFGGVTVMRIRGNYYYRAEVATEALLEFAVGIIEMPATVANTTFDPFLDGEVGWIWHELLIASGTVKHEDATLGNQITEYVREIDSKAMRRIEKTNYTMFLVVKSPVAAKFAAGGRMLVGKH